MIEPKSTAFGLPVRYCAKSIELVSELLSDDTKALKPKCPKQYFSVPNTDRRGYNCLKSLKTEKFCTCKTWAILNRGRNKAANVLHFPFPNVYLLRVNKNK